MTKYQNPTVTALIAEFGTREIPLAKVCKVYFGVNEKVAKERIAKGTFPVLAYRSSRFAPYLVRAEDLAKHLDECRERERQRFELIHVE